MIATSLVIATTLAGARHLSVEPEKCSRAMERGVIVDLFYPDHIANTPNTPNYASWCAREDRLVLIDHVRLPLLVAWSCLAALHMPNVLVYNNIQQLKVAFVRMSVVCAMGACAEAMWRRYPAFTYIQSLYVSMFLLSIPLCKMSAIDWFMRHSSMLFILTFAWFYGPPVPSIDIMCYLNSGYCGCSSHLIGILSPLPLVVRTIEEILLL